MNASNTFNFNTPEVSAPSISSSAMLVELSISQWTGKKTDKRVTRNVKASEGAVEAAGRFAKSLLPDEPTFERLNTLVGSARTEHYFYTMPWASKGPRLLTTTLFVDYQKTLSAIVNEFQNVALPAFLDNYDNMVQRAPNKLGSMFDPEDYPDVYEIQGKFSMTLNYFPVPTAGDFRVDVGNEAMEVLRDSYANYYKEQMASAYKDVWERTYKVLKNMSDRLEGEKAQAFHGTLVTNVTDMIELLDKFNVTDDPQMQRAKERLSQAMRGVTSEGLKEDNYYRAETKRTVDKILSEFEW